ncbi:hypothetical protein F5Y08DRAFT_53343 [Xylaria arbuscula]|nr:hypothetical protein F5Y08DRAFT_53343 [Xylaria arbuscula]
MGPPVNYIFFFFPSPTYDAPTAQRWALPLLLEKLLEKRLAHLTASHYHLTALHAISLSLDILTYNSSHLTPRFLLLAPHITQQASIGASQHNSPRLSDTVPPQCPPLLSWHSALLPWSKFIYITCHRDHLLLHILLHILLHLLHTKYLPILAQLLLLLGLSSQYCPSVYFYISAASPSLGWDIETTTAVCLVQASCSFLSLEALCSIFFRLVRFSGSPSEAPSCVIQKSVPLLTLRIVRAVQARQRIGHHTRAK